MVDGVFGREYGAKNFLQIVGKFLPEYTVSYPRKHEHVKVVIPTFLHTIEQVNSTGNASDFIPGSNLGRDNCYRNILAVGYVFATLELPNYFAEARRTCKLCEKNFVGFEVPTAMVMRGTGM